MTELLRRNYHWETGRTKAQLIPELPSTMEDDRVDTGHAQTLCHTKDDDSSNRFRRDVLCSGGPGAWELVSRFSYADLDSGPVQGGIFWRYTPLVNWYMSDNVCLEFEYGYGSLNRFNLVGKTQFFQTRIQLQF